MGSRIRSFAGILLALTAALASARTVTDDNGDKVEVPDHPERVVVANILPLAPYAVAFTGEPSRIAGMHPASMSAAKAGLLGKLYPQALQIPTRFIQGASLSIESLMTLNPDLVLVNAPDKRMLERVRSAGLTAFGISPVKWNYDVEKTFDGWTESLEKIFPDAKARGEVLRGEMKRVREFVEKRIDAIPQTERKRVLFIVRADSRELVVSGKRFFGESWCALTGSENAAGSIEAENANAAVSMESVYAWNPDAVILTNFTPLMSEDIFAGRDQGRDWSHVKAVEEKAVYKMPLGLYRTFTPSADAPVTLLWLAKTLYPKAFEDVNLVEEAKRYYRTGFGMTLTDDEAKAVFEHDAGSAENASASVRSSR